MKVCFKCGAAKPLDLFYRHAGMQDGYLNKCKECTKKDVRKHRDENDSVREYDRLRGNRQPAGYVKEYRQRFPKKYAAHTWVNNAMRDGRLTKPLSCPCGATTTIEGHHKDYDKPTEVEWLCSRCHSRWHVVHGEALNPF